jgi:hypothetical protein
MGPYQPTQALKVGKKLLTQLNGVRVRRADAQYDA